MITSVCQMSWSYCTLLYDNATYQYIPVHTSTIYFFIIHFSFFLKWHFFVKLSFSSHQGFIILMWKIKIVKMAWTYFNPSVQVWVNASSTFLLWNSFDLWIHWQLIFFHVHSICFQFSPNYIDIWHASIFLFMQNPY